MEARILINDASGQEICILPCGKTEQLFAFYLTGPTLSSVVWTYAEAGTVRVLAQCLATLDPGQDVLEFVTRRHDLDRQNVRWEKRVLEAGSEDYYMSLREWLSTQDS